MAAYINHGRTSLATRNSGRKAELSPRVSPILNTIVSKNHRTTAAKVKEELSIHLEEFVSTKTVRQELPKYNIHSRDAIANSLITKNNAKRRKRWSDDYKTRTSDDWKYITWSDESSFMLLPTSGRVCVCRTPKEVYNPECLVPTVKYGGRSVTILAAIFWYSAGPVITLHSRITVSDYVDIQGSHVHPMVQMLFPDNNSVFQGDISPIHTARSPHVVS